MQFPNLSGGAKAAKAEGSLAMRFCLVLCLLVLFACSGKNDGNQAGVEAGNAKIAGMLRDSLDRPLGNAIVGIYNQSSVNVLSRKMAALPAGAISLDTTDLSGHFELDGFAPGTYELQVEYQGTTWEKQDLQVVESESAIQMDVTLNQECVDVVIWIGGTKIAFLCEGSSLGEDTTDWGEDTLGFWDTIPISDWCHTDGNCGAIEDLRDGREYHWTKIGGRYWFAQNLDYANPNAGISRCYNDSVYYCNRYGRLYDWEAAKVACPAGWRVPTWGEWIALIDSVGGQYVAGEGFKLEYQWPKESGGDAFSFSAYPAGAYGDIFDGAGDFAMWWLYDTDYPQSNGRHVMYLETNAIGLIDTYSQDGFHHSLRCIYAGTGTP